MDNPRRQSELLTDLMESINRTESQRCVEREMIIGWSIKVDRKMLGF